MSGPLVTLTTDFGEGSLYVAALKGVLLQTNPDVRLVDLGHGIPAQDVRHAAFFLRATVPHFPADALHVIVVDPGVGTGRAILFVELGAGRLLVPDNGCWTGLCADLGSPRRVVRLANPHYWRAHVSPTFHGRDIFAPVAGHLTLGVDPAQLGPAVDRWTSVDLPMPVVTAQAVAGEVVFIDPFGNLLTNISRHAVAQSGALEILVADQPVTCQVQTYGQAPPGCLVALFSSLDTLEIAVNQGSAARRLGAAVGTPVQVTLRPPSDAPR